ncbi:MAG: class I SAM-dependent methyltransferase [Gemmatimonadota bacterium]|nr:class I SAM-dependent methyltransferase [Gemmatimonadota bacterium]
MFPIVDGIPVLLPDEIREHDELEHVTDPPGSRRRQAEFYDRAVAFDFEVSRPRGAPRLYESLLLEKFRRGTRAFRNEIRGSNTLVVCGGSGMDAEFLVQSGALVVTSDASVGASRRAVMRAQRHRLPIGVIAADVEHLPFADRSFDLVYVHDGLHHLAEPDRGLREMMRVARSMISVNEPARAAATLLAVRFGLAKHREDSGNLVARLKLRSLEVALEQGGFRVLNSERLFMYYRHAPGPWMRFASRPILFTVTRGLLHLADAVFGRAGNKLTIQAKRRQ